MRSAEEIKALTAKLEHIRKEASSLSFLSHQNMEGLTYRGAPIGSYFTMICHILGENKKAILTLQTLLNQTAEALNAGTKMVGDRHSIELCEQALAAIEPYLTKKGQ